MDDRTRDALLRWQRCKDISQSARFIGLDASPEFVNRHYRRFIDWYEGRLARGYLIRTTGVRKIPEHKG